MKRSLIARLIGLSLAALPPAIMAQTLPASAFDASALTIPQPAAAPAADAAAQPALNAVEPQANAAPAMPARESPQASAATPAPEAQQPLNEPPAAIVEPTTAFTAAEGQAAAPNASLTDSSANPSTDPLTGAQTPDPMNAAIAEGEQTVFNEPDDEAQRIAFLMAPKGSAFEEPTLLALKGLLAANYASETPRRILLVYPGANNSVVEQLDAAAQAGAMAAVGPIDRNQVEELSRLNYVPLPVITLNQVDLDTPIALTDEEIAAEKERVRLEQLSLKLQQEADAADPETIAQSITSENSTEAPATETVTETVDGQTNGQPAENVNEGVSIAAKTAVPGLVYADEISVSKFRYEPRIFPRNLLMLGLSMEDDASFIARLGVAALPDATESGEKPKVLLLDHDTALEKRISAAFERELVDAGFAPDRMTVDINDIRRVNQFFSLVVDKLDKDEFDEVPIDQEADPVGWRQQQIRIRRLQAAKRARAALSEPPYYAAFLAMDAKTASLVRSRLPLRTRVWGTPLINPGDTKNNPQAKAMTYDLMHVALTEAPLLLNYDIAAFEEKYKVPAPENVLQTRLFALGSDAYALALEVANGKGSGVIDGNLGTLHYNLSVSPLVERRGQTAMIYGGSVRAVTQEEVLNFQSLNTKARRLRAQSRSLERLEREAEAAAQAAGTLAPRNELDSETGVLDPLTAPDGESALPSLDLTIPEPEASQIELKAPESNQPTLDSDYLTPAQPASTLP